MAIAPPAPALRHFFLVGLEKSWYSWPPEMRGELAVLMKQLNIFNQKQNFFVENACFLR
jgi:hypothetical protein